MDLQLRDAFTERWNRYFPGAELPIALYYADSPQDADPVDPEDQRHCFIAQLMDVRKGQSVYYGLNGARCPGAMRYLGFSQKIMPNFEYFLSYGIPGQMEGERYKKSPELVREAFGQMPVFEAPATYAVFKRWDRLTEQDEPAVVIFFAPPDVVSGLFTLANYDEVDPNGVFAPFSAGCATIVQWPYLEQDKEHPRAVFGMFDVSARPCVQSNVLSFAVPMCKFVRMIGNMDESFLITHSWGKVKRRLP